MYHSSILRGLKSYKVNLVIKVLIASDFVVWSASNLVGPVLAIFVADILPGGSIEAVGIATMIYFICKSIVEIPVGAYIDKSMAEKDDLYSAVLGTVLSAVGYFLLPIINNVWQFYLLEVIFGASAAIAYPGWYSIFTRHIDESKAAFEWSLYDVLLGLGMAATAGLGAFMVERFGFNFMFHLIGVLTLMGAGLLFVIRKKIYLSPRKKVK